MRLAFCIALALLLFPALGWAQTIDPAVGRYDLRAELFEDPAGELSFEQIKQSAFSFPDVYGLTLGLSDSTLWLRFRLQNDAADPQRRIFEIGRATLTQVDLHLPDGAIKAHHRFDPFSKRDVATRTPAFHVTLPPQSETTLYVRVHSQSELYMPARLWSPDAFREFERDDSLLLGFSYGAMALIALYHLVLFIRLRERHLLWFAGYVLLVDAWLWLVDGIGYGQFETALPPLGFYPYATTIWAGLMCSALFARAFLETKQRAPRMHTAITAVLVAGCVLIVSQPLVDHRLMNSIGSFVFVLTYPLYIATGIVVWRRGMRAAGLFVLAWSFYVFGSVWIVLAINGVVPFYDREYLNPFRLGIIADAVLMSLALATRIQTIGRERAEARALAIAQGQLADAEKSAALGRLMAGMLHEVNTPLGALRSAAATLGKALSRVRKRVGDDDPKTTRHLDIGADLSGTIDASSERIASVVDSLKRFVAVDEGEAKRSDVREGIEGAMMLLQRGDVRVVSDFPDEPAMALCKPAQLNRALLELMRRAVDAMDEGTVTVTVAAADDAVTITIADDGPAIDAGALFDFGFAKHQGKVRMSMGLPLAKQAIDDMGGSVRVESDHTGTRATVTLAV